MSAPTLQGNAPPTRPDAARGLRFRLKPAHRSCGYVQGAWWPHTDQLLTELPILLEALVPRFGRIHRVIYDETSWAPTSLRMEFRGYMIVLEGSAEIAANTVAVIGEGFGSLVLLVVPPYTNPSSAYTTVMTACEPDDVSSPDELLGIGAQQAENRRLALLAHQRWESDGGALGPEHDATAAVATRYELKHAQ